MGGGTVTNIGTDAFALCSKLTNVVIGNSVTVIGNLAFYDCGISSITLPASVANIGNSAFEYCSGLTNLTFLSNAPALGNVSVFYNLAYNATVYYHAGTTGWSSIYGGLPTVQLASLLSPPLIFNASVSSGNFHLTINGASNQVVTIEAGTNLVNWQSVWTNTLSSTATNFMDVQWKNYSHRFYRAY